MYSVYSKLKPADDNFVHIKTNNSIKYHLIQAMIQQDNLYSSFGLVDKHISRMGITVNVALHKDHLTVKLAQLLAYL